MASMAACKFQAMMLSLATRRTYGVRRSVDGRGVDLVEVCVEPGGSVIESASYGSARDMLTYLEGRTDAARQVASEAAPAAVEIQAAKVLTPADERLAMTLSYRELAELVIVHEPEDDPAAPCRSYVVGVPVSDDLLFVGVIAAPAPAPVPALGDLRRVAIAAVINS